ncbi:MAG: hypothetical protein AB1465_06105 [Patescibacteria group bacterium]
MRILSLEESKKIVEKFLKYFNLYDEKRVKRYFKKQYFLRLGLYGLIPCPFIFKGTNVPLFNKLELPNEIKNGEFKDILEKYEDYFTFSNETHYAAFPWMVEALKKITNKEVFACADNWEFYGNRGINQRVLKYHITEFFSKEQDTQNYVDKVLCSHEKVYLFPEDFLFFIELGDTDLIASSKNFISKFKNALKHKNYDRLCNLKKGDVITINNISYKTTGIKLENHHARILYIYLDKDDFVLVSTLYNLGLWKTKYPIGVPIFKPGEYVKSIKF